MALLACATATDPESALAVHLRARMVAGLACAVDAAAAARIERNIAADLRDRRLLAAVPALSMRQNKLHARLVGRHLRFQEWLHSLCS